MDAIVVRGGPSLNGEVSISGAKNAALPLLASSLLTTGRCTFSQVPELRDVATMRHVLVGFGAAIDGQRSVGVDTTDIVRFEAPYDLVRTMRASVLVLGPLLARYGRARVSLPGGCAIGARPIDVHLDGLRAMGAQIALQGGYVEARCKRLHGARIVCEMPTVTGTMNLMMAAALAEGESRIENAAREPEVVELAAVLAKMGAKVAGAGGRTITIEGVEALQPVDHEIMPDRIEAGTFMVAAAITRGDVRLLNCRPQDLQAAIDKLGDAGARVELGEQWVRVSGVEQFCAFDLNTAPHPGFPTDMQAQFMVLASLGRGRSVINETIFENRFMHVPELTRMNARIQVAGCTAVVEGPARLCGATVMASDLRASAALILAGLVAEGETRVRRVYHLDRGYEAIERKLCQLGADVERVRE